MIADALAMQAAMASIVIVSAEFSRIIPTSATDG